MGRAPCCDKENVKRGPWAPEEDVKLKAYIEQYGTGGNWIALPQKVGLKRCGKSCRLRWLNYLRPNIKHGGFSEEEDNIICSLYISIGSRWSIIAAQLPGRTDNDIKNYWNTRLKKKLLGRRKDSQARRLSFVNQDENGMKDSSYSQTISNSALERMQLHMHFQSLQNPMSFYNNPALWPKLHPYGEQSMQAHYGLNNNYAALLATTQIEKIQEEKLKPATINMKQDEDDNSIEQFNSNFQSVPSLLAELGDAVFDRTGRFMTNGDQINEFNCFKEMNNAKDGASWWDSSFDTNSSSSNSWDSASGLPQEGLFQDCVLGYEQ